MNEVDAGGRQQPARFLTNRVEYRAGIGTLGDERGDPAQRRLLAGQAPQALPRLGVVVGG